MGKDYYQQLKLNHGCCDSEIKRSFRKYAIKFHPSLYQGFSDDEQRTRYQLFCEFAEAYEVLSDPIKKAFYDQFGEEKLKEGFFSKGEIRGGYRFNGNPEEIFNIFFESTNPYSKIYDDEGDQEYGTLFSQAFGAQNYIGQEPLPDLVIEIKCTLDELYNGCQKQVEYDRNALNQDAVTTSRVTQIRQIEIKPGYNSTSTIKFKGEGQECQNVAPSDLIFKIVEVPHSKYTRKGDDLILTTQITLVDALLAKSFQVVALDGRSLYITVDEIISPETRMIVASEGMPIYSADDFTLQKSIVARQAKGNLFIYFDIAFPQILSENSKNQIRSLLNENDNSKH